MSGSFGPFATRPGILQRSTDFVDLTTRTTPEQKRLRLWGARTLNDAYGNLAGSGVGGAGGNILMDGPAGVITQTPEVAKRWRVEESRRGLTSLLFDINDFALSPGSIGSDDEYLFVRLQEMRKTTNAWLQVAAGPNAGWNIQGPIMPIPPAIQFGLGGMGMTLTGIAPAGTLSTVGHVPNLDESVTVPLPMHIALPRPSYLASIRNIDAAETLLFSFGLGMPMSPLLPGTQTSSFGTLATYEIVLAGLAGPCEFVIDVSSDLSAE